MKSIKCLVNIVFTFIIIFAFTSCNSYDFGQEQYKNEVSLLSNSAFVYDRQVAKISEEGDTIYIVAGLSGTNFSTKPFNVGLIKEDSLFHAYNKSNFDIDVTRFAKILPEECFSLLETKMQIKTGEFQAKFPVHLKNLDKLSPDTIYFLDYELDPENTSDYNPRKNKVLLRIYKNNEYATTKTNTFYNYTTSYVTTMEEGGIVRRPTNANQVFPLGENSVRMLAGDEEMGDYNTALGRINARSIKVTVGDQVPYNPAAKSVVIEPYGTIDVVQMPPTGMYDNTYTIKIISTPDGRNTYYKEFKLHYKYRTNPTSVYKEVKAVLRMEYNPRAELL